MEKVSEIIMKIGLLIIVVIHIINVTTSSTVFMYQVILFIGLVIGSIGLIMQCSLYVFRKLRKEDK
ncbi:hypothetical protein J2S78_000752 [Salibacterium salarium]|uniref:hypothetical protein n=1 Tax=Salibacterium salarium TaxID=284579 RepID=UPI002787A06E|nr:hypothetical protein [Salibacterium salarium]MDQ0298344.1 hypothetical protein [Salibacterium salarium]